jgi:hypothetical protein
MTRLTNKHHLPDAIVRAVQNDPYDKGESTMTATGLLQPPQIAGLTRIYWDRLEEDVTDRIWALLGQSLHTVLERAEHPDSNVQLEKRLYVKILGETIGAKFDRLNLENHLLSDYKMTSAWTKVFGSRIPEWEKQMNIYTFILRANGHQVDAAEIVAFYRDWSATNAQRSGSDYPQVQCEALPVAIWPVDKQEEYITERVRLHQDARKGKWPECSPEDRWAKPDTWAVMKHGRKTAVRVFENKWQAEDYLDSTAGSGFYIEHRKGSSPRCEGYCPVSAFCRQFRGKDAPPLPSASQVASIDRVLIIDDLD